MIYEVFPLVQVMLGAFPLVLPSFPPRTRASSNRPQAKWSSSYHLINHIQSIYHPFLKLWSFPPSLGVRAPSHRPMKFATKDPAEKTSNPSSFVKSCIVLSFPSFYQFHIHSFIGHLFYQLFGKFEQVLWLICDNFSDSGCKGVKMYTITKCHGKVWIKLIQDWGCAE